MPHASHHLRVLTLGICADLGEAEAFLDAACIATPPLAVVHSVLNGDALEALGVKPFNAVLSVGDSMYHSRLAIKLVRFSLEL